MSRSSGSDQVESLNSDLSAPGVRFDDINHLMLLILFEMRSTNADVAYGQGASGFALSLIVTLLIGLAFVLVK